jgi:hypothetical protein
MREDLILNIYGQEAWHTDAKIVASKDALVRLRKGIDEALVMGTATIGEGEPPLFASDGEGYALNIVALDGWKDERWAAWESNPWVFAYTFTMKGE